MIVGLKKYLIYGVKQEVELFFSRAQTQGFIEFISPTRKKPLPMTEKLQQIVQALRILRKLPVKPAYTGYRDLAFADKTAENILALKLEDERLQEQLRMLNVEIARVQPFGEFSKEDISYIERASKKVIQFYCRKTSKRHEPLPENLIYVATEYDLDYFIGIHDEPTSYPNMFVVEVPRPVNALKEEREQVRAALHDVEAELKHTAIYNDMLQDALVDRLNEHRYNEAKDDVAYPLNNAFFAVEAWVPKNKVRGLDELIDAMAIQVEPIEIEKEDAVPTCMHNKNVNRLGEDLVQIYDIPAHTDRDPSGWVFWFFMLFFAMIVGDAGYGLIYVAFSSVLLFKNRRTKSQRMRRFCKLLFSLSCACVLWGFFTSSFFGLQFSPKSWVSRISVVQYLAERKADYALKTKNDIYQEWVAKYPAIAKAKTGREMLDLAVAHKANGVAYEMQDSFAQNVLLEFSMIAGIIHISTSFLRYFLRNWAGIGWVIFMLGGYLYAPSSLKASTIVYFLEMVSKPEGEAIGLQMIYFGIAIAFLLALIQKRLKGIKEMLNTIQVFTDVLSYLRLYALGLAGFMLASTFNGIAQSAGLFLGVLVLLGGHAINVAVGIFAGLIHGLRLNFIEWYHYSFIGGGRLFNPLVRLKRE